MIDKFARKVSVAIGIRDFCHIRKNQTIPLSLSAVRNNRLKQK